MLALHWKIYYKFEEVTGRTLALTRNTNFHMLPKNAIDFIIFYCLRHLVMKMGKYKEIIDWLEAGGKDD